MTTGATCVDCNKVIAGFPALGPGWATICNACERKRAAGVYQSDVDGAGSIPGSYLRKGPTGRWGAEISDAARKAAERYCGPEKPVGKVDPGAATDAKRCLEELLRLRKMDADIRGAILQRRHAEGGSDVPYTASSVRHTFKDRTTMELVGWALRRMHSFKKDRDYWCVEHRRVRDEKEEAQRNATDWEKAAKGASIATHAMEARYTAAAGELAAYKRKFEIEQATANDLRAQLSAKTSELAEALNAANENRRATESERALRVAAEGRAKLLAGPQVTTRPPWAMDAALQGVIAAMGTELRNALVSNTLGVPNELAQLEPWNLARRVSIVIGEQCASLRIAADGLRDANKRLADALTAVGNMRGERDTWRTRASKDAGVVTAPLPWSQEHSEIVRLRAQYATEAARVNAVAKERDAARTALRILADITNDYSKALNGVPAWLRARSARLVEGEPLMWSRRDELLNTARAWEEEEEHAPQAQGTVAP